MRPRTAALFAALFAALVIAGCDSGSSTEPTPTAPGEAAAPSEAAAGEQAPEGTAAPTPSAEEPAEDTWVDGVYASPAFNVRFTLPDGWRRADDAQPGPAGLGTSSDSITFVGPGDAGLRLVVANSDSIQLVDASFANLTESIGFENVRIVPDASQARTFNGIPGYRTEADALLRGEPVPQYIIAQALELPGQPTMFTIFVNGDQYDLHSANMKAILDSIEVLNIRPQ